MTFAWFGWVSRRGLVPYALLVLVPFVLWACNGSWLWDSSYYHDTNVYVGFFRHYLEFTWPYVENYKSSRLPFVLPGVLGYALLPAGAAHHLLHLGFLLAQAWLVYFLTQPRFGARAAFVAAAALLAFTYSHNLPSYHNQASSTYFVAALALLEHPRRFSLPLRAALASGTLAWAGTTNSVIVTMVPLFLLRAVAVAGPLSLRLVLQSTAAGVMGAVLALGLLGALNVALGGPFLFFMEQVRYSLGMAKAASMSKVSALGMLARVGELPQLIFPLVTCAAAFWLLVERVVGRRRDWALLEAVSLLLGMALAAYQQDAGVKMVEEPCLFHPFFAPMFLSLPALISAAGRPAPTGEELLSEPPITRFALLTVALLVSPLSLFGARLSRLVPHWQLEAPGIASSVPLALSLGVLTLLVMSLIRAVAVRAVLFAASFGLMNALSPAHTQPAYDYQLGSSCSFRKDAFDAVFQADALFAKFDPKSEARWKSIPVRHDLPKFDGKSWCSQLPIATVARNALLPRYFYTSDEILSGAKVLPLKKIALSANTVAELDELQRQAWTGIPPGSTTRLAFERLLVFPTFTLALRGYDVTLPR